MASLSGKMCEGHEEACMASPRPVLAGGDARWQMHEYEFLLSSSYTEHKLYTQTVKLLLYW